MNTTCKKYILLLLLMAYHLIHAVAQKQQAAIKELKVGDQCPDFTFDNFVNYPKTSAHLSDFKGRLVVLDFWATWCGSCLNALPKLDSLQHHFGTRIMVIPVSYEETGKVKLFIENNAILRRLNLPFVTKDSTLTQYFRHSLIPHEVCIDGNGEVVAITDAEDLTPHNVELLLAGNQSAVGAKNDIVDHDYYNSPLLAGGLGKRYAFNKADLKYSSILTNYINGLPSIHGAPNVYGDVAKIISTNSDIAGLYQTAFATKNKPFTGFHDPDFYLRLPSRTIWEAKDSALRMKLYHWPGRTGVSWRTVPDSQKTFCYELILPKADSLKLNTYAIEDLNRYFGNLYGITGLVEKRKIKCWILVVTDEKLIVISKGGTPDINMDENHNRIVLKNYKINDFLFWWLGFEMSQYPMPIINETNFNLPIDMDINANPKNLNEVNEGLKKYGLEFKEVERNLNMIVITDKK